MAANNPRETLRPPLAAFLAFVVVCLGVLSSGAETAAIGAQGLPSANVVEPAGLTDDLKRQEGVVRVEILLADQPLVKAAARPSIRALLDAEDTDELKATARRKPGSIAPAEKGAALQLEDDSELARSRLGSAARATLGPLASVRVAVEEQGGSILDAQLIPASLVARIPARGLDQLQRRDDVQAISPSAKPRRLLNNATPSTGAPSWFAGGHTGGEGPSDSVSVDVGLLGENPEPSHPAFAGVGLEQLGCCVGDHGTHVGGVVASQNATYGGAAPGIDTLLGGRTPRILGFDDETGSATNDPAEVLNFSFGAPADDDDEDDPLDLIGSVFDVGISAAGGNENVNGSPTVNNIGRNQLSMAYYFDNNDTVETNDIISGNSSNGPSPGGRKKPDLIAPGSQLIGPDADWNNPPSNPDYTSISGSSFSAPYGTAALALLEGAAIGDSSAQRAILVNGARDWNGQNNNITHGWSSGNQGSWRPEVGWGVLDLSRAFADRGNYELASVGKGSARFFRANSTSGSKATLAWELRGTWEGYPANGSDPIAFTVSDLDLSQYRASTLAAIAPPSDPGHGGGPDAGDSNDTVEQVRAPSGGGQLIYKVSSESTIVGLSSEPFAIASTEPLTPLVSPEVEPFGLATNAGASTSCSSTVTVTASFRNDSPDLDASGAEASISLPSGVTLVSGPQTQSVSGGELAAGTSSSEISWSVRATSGGQKTITIAGAGGTMGETFTSSSQVSFIPDCSPPETTITSGPTGPTNDTTPSFGFSSSESASFQCSVDGAAFSGCSSPLTTAALPEGAHEFRVRAIDAAGNVDSSPATRTFTVDITVPTASIDGPALTNRKSPTFTLTSSESGTFQCAVDDGAFAACASPYRPPQLGAGDHNLRVRAVDQAGNVGPATALRFTVDLKVRDADLTAKKTQKQKGKMIKVKLKVSAQEEVEVRGKGKIKIGGKDVRLKAVRKSIEGGEATVLRLKPKKKRDRRRVFGALRAGKKVRSNPSVKFTDLAGNKASERRTIRLK